MSAVSQLQRAAFDSIEFPIRSCTVTGGLRDHVHEYLKTPGGAPEKLGRKLYTIKMTAPFLDVFPTYPNTLYPGDLGDLMERFEQELTSSLVIPQIGTIQAYAVNWSRHLEAKQQSGEVVEIEFREDQSSAFLVQNLVNIQAKDLSTVSGSLFDAANDLDIADDFASLESAIAQVTGFVDLVELYGAAAMSLLDDITSRFAILDVTIPALQQPVNQAFIDAFLAAWKATTDLQQNLLKISTPIVAYTTTRLMAISEVSRALYGDASHASDLLTMNGLDDPFQIPQGTKMKVWSPSFIASAA